MQQKSSKRSGCSHHAQGGSKTMARDHARVNIAIWGSTEFRTLSPAAQHLYFVLVTSSTLNYAGVADWRPKRLAALSESWTEDDVNRAAHELSRERVVIIDEDTEEALVRTWIKHDGLIDQPRMAVSVANAYAGISSIMIRGVIVHELGKLKESKPALKGWAKPKLLEVLDEPETDPNETRIYPLPEVQLGANGSQSETADLGQTEVRLGPNQTSATPAPTPATYSKLQLHTPRKNAQTAYPDDFELFWDVYPKKDDKRRAFKAWTSATSRASIEEIIEGATNYRDDPNREEVYTKNPSTWLNADAWANGPLPDRARPSGRVEPRNRAQERMDNNKAVIENLRRIEESYGDEPIQGELL